MAPQVGLEPTTLRLTAACSANWAIEERQNILVNYLPSKIIQTSCPKSSLQP